LFPREKNTAMIGFRSCKKERGTGKTEQGSHTRTSRTDREKGRKNGRQGWNTAERYRPGLGEEAGFHSAPGYGMPHKRGRGGSPCVDVSTLITKGSRPLAREKGREERKTVRDGRKSASVARKEEMDRGFAVRHSNGVAVGKEEECY